MHIHILLPGKCDPRAIKCLFLGYSFTQMEYECYHPPTKENVTMGIIFVEIKHTLGTPIFMGRANQEKIGGGSLVSLYLYQVWYVALC